MDGSTRGRGYVRRDVSAELDREHHGHGTPDLHVRNDHPVESRGGERSLPAEVARMSQRARLILVIVAGFLLCLAVYFLLVRSRQGELNELNDSIAAEQSRTAQLQAELDRLRDLQARAPELQAELDRFRALVPKEHE